MHTSDTITLPPEVLRAKTMLSEQELGLLYSLARDHYTGRGEIVDGGAFLGGSTLALACGLRDNPRLSDNQGRIHSYDLFRADRWVNDFLPGYPMGTSTRPYFDAVIADVAAHVSVHEGNITTFPWPTGHPIEILFIDVAKNWTINDFLLGHFFPNLIPGVSTIVQQDYHWPRTPWISVTMELLADHVTYLGSMPWATAHYRWERALQPGELPSRLRDLGAEQLRTLADRAQRFERGGREWAAQQCNLVSLCMALGQAEDALTLFDEAVNAAPTWVEYHRYELDFSRIDRAQHATANAESGSGAGSRDIASG